MTGSRHGSTRRPAPQRRLPRRLVIFAAALLVLSLSGLGLLLFRWWGERGAPPASRLYVQGAFERAGRLAVLERDGGSGNACFRVAADGEPTSTLRVCRGKPLRVWVEDALLDLTVGARGVPRVSIAGLRARQGDFVGSLADSKRLDHPRFPLRAQGVPGTAGRVVACPPSSSPTPLSSRPSGPPHGELCLEVHDRLGRVAIVRRPEGAQTRGNSAGDVEIPNPGDVVRLGDGDALWMGLVAFVARPARASDDTAPVLILDRVDRLRPGRRAGETQASDLGGDRRWLGRLWHVESPDPSTETPDRFEIYPMRQRYTPYNLSRQRTNLEGEDVIQRLIDGGWLCLESASGAWRTAGATGASPQLAWQPLDRPGCDGESQPGGLTRSSIEDYRRARFGDLSFLAGSLMGATNVALATDSYLEDATRLPFVFDWRLSATANSATANSATANSATAADAADDKSLRRLPQPVPSRLWGIRFGITRQVRRSLAEGRGLPPTVLPRASTARHLFQVLRGDELLSTFYLPASAAPEEGDPAPVSRGAVCLGRHGTAGGATPEDGVPLVPLRPTSGGHHPLGSVAFPDDPRTGTWSPDPDAACDGCRLTFEQAEASGLSVDATGSCDQLRPAPPPSPQAPTRLAHGEALSWGDLRLRYVERGPWLAATDPGTGRRHFAEELYLRGRLRPLLGDAAALSGVEAALRELLEDSGTIGVAPDLETLELTIDGDLQLAASAIVDALARPQIAGDDPEPHRVSVTAAILDARGGDLLAAVNWSSATPAQTPESTAGASRRNAWSQPTAWELGSGQADVLENAALLRRGAIGSTMKITGSYALLNNDALTSGPELTRRRRGRAFLEAPVDRGRLYLHRGIDKEPSSGRRCSTGPHHLPAGDAGFTTGTFIRRFAASCNNFFVMTGFRHASSTPASLRSVGPPSGGREPSSRPAGGAGPQELLVDLRQRGRPTLVGPSPNVQSLAERIRDGLAGDSASDSRLPRSLYGILLALGFQPRPAFLTVQGEAPAELAFDRPAPRHRAQPVTVALANTWFSPATSGSTPGPATPALKPGRDFSYPGVPSPGRLDEAAVRGQPVLERYDGEPRTVQRFAEGRADVQWSMLLIGQSSIEASAVGLASLYAPAARADGRAVSPCLFRANCGPHRAGARVIDPAGPNAEVLNQALFAVLHDGTARGGLSRIGRRHLTASGWGGKTGTYQVERGRLVGLSTDQWRHLRTWACGVGGVTRPDIAAGGGRATELAGLLSRAPAGSALGARVCEDAKLPLNPAGVHSYRGGELPAKLDQLAAELRRSAESDTLIYHSFVTLVPPVRGEQPEHENPAEGIVVAVLVDHQTADKSVAIQIGAELAAAAERWAVSR